MSDEYTCEECDRSFDSERGLHIHQGRVHDMHEYPDEEEADTNAGEEGAGVVAREEDGRVSVSMSVFHAIGVTFVLGIVFGGFIMGAAAQVTHGTGLNGDQTSQLLQQLQEADTGSQDTGDSQQDTQDTGSGDAGSGRVMLTSDMIQDEPTLGSSDAPVTIVEYSDFGCPWCAEWAGFDAIPQRPIDSENSLEQIVSNYVDSGDVRFVFKDYPVPRLHPNAQQAHQAANCVLEQGDDMYWEYHDLLFENRQDWTSSGQGDTDSTFSSLAEQVGADVTAFEQCYQESDGSETSADKSNIEQLDGALGTPTFFIGNTEDGFVKVEGAQPYSGLKPLIDSQIENATA